MIIASLSFECMIYDVHSLKRETSNFATGANSSEAAL